MTYTYESYKKGQKVYQQLSTGEQGDFLGIVSRQTKYSFFYTVRSGPRFLQDFRCAAEGHRLLNVAKSVRGPRAL